MRNMRQQGTSREATFFSEKWKIFDNYVLLIAEKKYKATHKQNSRFNAPSVTRANTKKSAPTHNCKNKKCPKFKIGDVEKACTHVASTCEKIDSRGHQGRPLLVGATLSTTLCVNSDKDCCLQTRFVTWVSMLVLLLLPLELPKWKFFDSYVFLLAEKKYKATRKQTLGLTPRRSPGRIQRKCCYS